METIVKGKYKKTVGTVKKHERRTCCFTFTSLRKWVKKTKIIPIITDTARWTINSKISGI